uniref:(northern house mosquito) hypothetical protein n=1 Tax=Culex pipiens TaxID=7175 RepID=A0A8D8CGR1_CULPI
MVVHAGRLLWHWMDLGVLPDSGHGAGCQRRSALCRGVPGEATNSSEATVFDASVRDGPDGGIPVWPDDSAVHSAGSVWRSRLGFHPLAGSVWNCAWNLDCRQHGT